MPQERTSKIQFLSAKHEGIMQAVDKMLDKFASSPQVQEMIAKQFGEKLSTNAVLTYKKKHWKVQKDRVRDQKATMKGVAAIIGEDGLDAAVNALLWQSLQSLTALQLIALKKVVNDDKKVAILKQEFALSAQVHHQKMKELTSAEKTANAHTELVDDYDAAQRTVQQVKEIFGIGMTDLEPRCRTLPGPAEKPPSAV